MTAAIPDARPRDFVAFWRHAFEPESSCDAVPPVEPALEERAHEAGERVRERCGSEWSGLPDAVRDGLAGSLTQDLCDLAAIAPGRPAALPPRIAALLDLTVRTWTDSVAELLARLERDRALLNAGPVSRIDIGLSDRHHDGRTVADVRFEGGRSWIYKPRDVSMEHAYGRLLRFLDEAGAPDGFRSPRIIPREGYGWVEAIRPAPCTSDDGVQTYYRRAGGLSLLWWVLDATDINMFNVIACGPHPVLIDGETFFQSHGPARSGDASERCRSLERLSFFPRRETGRGVSFDITGLGGLGRQRTDRRIPVWRDGEIVHETAYLKGGENVVRDGRGSHRASAHAASLESGFREMGTWLMRHAGDLLAPAGPIEAMAGRPRRQILRRTRDYFDALNASLHLEAPASVVSFADAGLSPAEIDALARLDIPRFVSRPDALPEDPASREVRERLRTLDVARLDALWSTARLALAREALTPPTDHVD